LEEKIGNIFSDKSDLFSSDCVFSEKKSSNGLGVASSDVFSSGSWLYPLSDIWERFS
jgi:hypothetical protein